MITGTRMWKKERAREPLGQTLSWERVNRKGGSPCTTQVPPTHPGDLRSAPPGTGDPQETRLATALLSTHQATHRHSQTACPKPTWAAELRGGPGGPFLTG